MFLLIFVSKFCDCKSDKIIATAINIFSTNVAFYLVSIFVLLLRSIFYGKMCRLFQFPFEKYCFESKFIKKLRFAEREFLCRRYIVTDVYYYFSLITSLD